MSEIKTVFRGLYKSLKGKDFGVRNGVIPIYVAYCLSGKIGTPLVYYDRIENEISAQILSKADEEPEKCYLYIERNDGEKEEYLENIIKIFDIWQSTDEVLTQKTQMLSPMKKLRMITNGLQQWYRSLSGYCRYVSLDICSEDKVENEKTGFIQNVIYLGMTLPEISRVQENICLKVCQNLQTQQKTEMSIIKSVFLRL